MFRKSSTDQHAWVEARLSAYVDNRLAAGERARLDAHLRDCARCQSSRASLQWTIGLVKQSPAPALPRAFTLRAPTPSRIPHPASRFTLPALRFATALATLLLIALVGVDFITQSSGTMQTASAPAAEKLAAPTQAALATLQPTLAPRGAQPAIAATPTPDLKSANDAAQKPSPPPPAPAAGAAITATPAPTRAAIVIPTAPAPTATGRVEARVEPTRAVESAEETPRVAVVPLRIAEIGLLTLTLLLAAATVLIARKTRTR